jgi:hypothetical protein
VLKIKRFGIRLSWLNTYELDALDWFIQFGHLGYIHTCCEVGIFGRWFVIGIVLEVGGRFLIFVVLFAILYDIVQVMVVPLLYGLIIGILGVPWWRFFGTIIIDSGLGRDTRLSCIIDVSSGIGLLLVLLSGLSLFDVPLFLFTQMIWGLIFCVGRMLLEVFSLFIVFGILFIYYKKKWSDGSLYDINILSYGLLFVRPFWLKINLCPMVSFRLTTAFYIGVVGKMLITYFLIARSVILFSMIFVLNVLFLLGSILG